jgi:nondiscriminating aspartyl-tRNA synthetase
MQRTLIRDLEDFAGQKVKIQGWAQTIRDQKSVQFLIVRDHTGIVQVVVARSEKDRIINATISSLAVESAVEIVGKVVENPRVKLRGIEVQVASLTVVNAAPHELPIPVFSGPEANLDKRLNWRFLDLRRPEHLPIFRVQTTVEMAMREFWISEGFIEIHSPKLMGSASESGAELFSLDYFGKTAYLAQSPQFYKQMAMAAGFDKVFEIGPAFRADPSYTPRHATEFTSVDMEISWVKSHEDVMSFEERWLQYVLETVKKKHGEEILETFGVEVRIPSIPFPRITMQEALEILTKQGYTPEREGDLDPQGERLIAEYAANEFDHEFVFLTDYPVSVRPFYHMRYASNPLITKSFDLLWKGLEVTTGAQREHRYEVLVKQALEKGLSLEPIQFYLDFFKFGCPPHGGFGFGLARTLMAMLDIGNVREISYIYRGPTRLYP